MPFVSPNDWRSLIARSSSLLRQAGLRVVSTLAAILAVGSLAVADDIQSGHRGDVCSCRSDSISEINIRRCWRSCAADGLNGVQVSSRLPSGRWQFLSLAAWTEQVQREMDAGQIAEIVVWVHGNRVGCQAARRWGMSVYRALSAQACGGPPIHFMIFSWPSEKVGGPIEDIRVKSGRTDRAAYKLARVLGELPAEVPVGLIGFSFGARISAAAVHLRQGGRIGRFTATTGGTYRMVFMAAALECGSMLPGSRYGQGVAGIDRLLLLNNRRDPALKRYGIVDPQRRPEALGYRGIACPQRLAAWADQQDVSRLVGRTHDLEPYLANCGLMRAAWQTLAVDCGSTVVASLD